MSVEKNPITPEGAQKLRDELHRRKTVDRPEISAMIGAAREHGDLKENGEYHAAREKGGFNEGRIKELEDKIARMEIIDPSKLAGDRVAFGATVKLLNTANDEEVSYRIIGADEADIASGSIAITAPIAKSLLGKEVGDEVKIRTPAGERVYEILAVEFKSGAFALNPLDPVDRLPGLGPTARTALAEHGIRTVADLLWTAPVGWDDLRAPLSLKSAIQRATELGSGRFTFAGIVSSASFMPFRGRRGVRVVLQDAQDAACKLHAFWFFSAHGVLAMAKVGAPFLGIGKITVEPKKPPRTAHPDLFADGPEARVARPRYPRLGPKGALLRKAIAVAAPALSESASASADPVPPAIAVRTGLPPVNAVICNMHAIGGGLPSASDQSHFLERLAWTEGFTRAWERLEVEEGLAKTPAPVLARSPRIVAQLEKELGFELTKDQRAACDVVAKDLASKKPMRRLLLGDVGTGKTAVALAAVAQAVLAGKQAAILAPTSVLAEQYVTAVQPLERAVKSRAVLVTAGLAAAERRSAEKALASGEARIAIGTHALLGSSVVLPDLGLVVVDEQQRLGVAQRLSLVRKGERPHLLTLSATPIPRTLALALRGELATTTLRERPAGRKPVSTTMLPKTALRAVVTLVEAAVSRSERVFWVVPRVEDNGEDEEVDELASLTERVQFLRGEVKGIGSIHGKMKAAEKTSAMASLRSGATPVLVGTTVIEVGVDVPEATLMVIEDAEQFGLAQLHQLRGRVGRGERRGECILLHSDPLGDLARTRLERLCELSNGDDVAKADLDLRGAGDLSGTRQHGEDEPLLYLDESATWPWLADLEADARTIRAADRKLEAPEHRVLASIVAKLRRAIAVREEAG